MVLQKFSYASSTELVSRGSNSSESLFVIRMYIFQLALRKFHRLYGSLDSGIRFFENIISSGRCWNLGSFSEVRLSNCKLSRSALKKSRSGQVPVFQRQEKKLEAFLELYMRVTCPWLPSQPSILHLDW